MTLWTPEMTTGEKIFPRVSGPPFIAHSSNLLGIEEQLLMAAGSNAAWPAADRAIFVPTEVEDTLSLTELFVRNGATITGNIDIGFYDESMNRLASTGSTAQAGASSLQAISVGPVTVHPGRYWIALALNSTGHTYRWTGNAAGLAGLGIKQQASAFPLPDPASWVDAATAYYPQVGAHFRSVAM